MTAAVLWPAALATLHNMGQLRIESDSPARHAAFSGCIWESWQHAQSLLDIEEARGYTPWLMKDLDDAAAVFARASWGSWGTAGFVLARLGQNSIEASLRTQTAAISGLSSASAWWVATSACESLPTWDAQLLTTVAGACTRAMQWAKALQYFQGKTVKSLDQKMRGLLVDALAKGQQLQKVMETLDSFRSFRLQTNLITLTAAIGACGSAVVGGCWPPVFCLRS